MQENNNFETIISTWRRLSGEQIEAAGVSMSGDSPDFKPHKKKEETELLMPDKPKAPITSIASASTAITASEIPTDSSAKPEEKQEFIQRDKGDTKDAAGDTNDRDFKNDKGDEYFENDKVTNKSDKQEDEKYEDKVDSVYLRPPPAHKARPRSNSSTVEEEEDCGIKCLYYTLQCCDCVLM